MTTMDILRRTKAAWPSICNASAEDKNRILSAMADSLQAECDAILRCNAEDMDAARGHISDVMLDRLYLDKERIDAMADGGRGLLARHIRRTAGQIELADAHADRAGRDENDLMTCIFQVAEHFAQPLHALNVQPPGRVRECGSADFNNDSHNDPSYCMMASIIAHRAQNCIPFCLCCAKDAPKIPRARPDSSATCSRSIWRSAVRS